MAETIKKYLNDSFAARWAALVLIALAMFFAYMFVDVMSPLQSTSSTYVDSLSLQVLSSTRWEYASPVSFRLHSW